MAQKRRHSPRALSPSDGTTRYFALADELARRIAAGRMKSRARLPGEYELASSFGVSRVTVRSALRVLEEKGLIVRRPGVGTFVAVPRVQHDLAAMESLFTQFVSQDVPAETKLLDYRPVVADKEVRELLGHAEAMFLRRLWWVDSVPFALTCMYMHPAAKNASFADAETHPGYLILEKVLGYKIARAEIKIRAERANKNIAALLDIRRADPVLVLDRTSFSAADKALEHTECFIRSDAIEFRLLISGSLALGAGFQRPSKVTHLAAKRAVGGGKDRDVEQIL